MTHPKTTINDTVLLKKLNEIRDNKATWETSFDFTASQLNASTPKIQAKVLWMLGEMGLLYPEKTAPFISQITDFLKNRDDLLKERAINACGRIGRADYDQIQPYWNLLLSFVHSENPKLRLALVWAAENIATNYPDEIGKYLDSFAPLLQDTDEKVRMEAPELFRVLGKRTPEYTLPYLDQLTDLSENDTNRVVKIHANGAIKAIHSHNG